jgi:hypothetical protein
MRAICPAHLHAKCGQQSAISLVLIKGALQLIMAATNSFPESVLVGWLAALPASEKVHVIQQRYLLQYRTNQAL